MPYDKPDKIFVEKFGNILEYGPQRHQGAKGGKWSAAVGKSAYGLVTHLARSIMLLYVGKAVTEERVNNGIRYARQTSAEPRQTRILYAPNPGGEINGQAPLSDSTSVLCAAPLT